MSQGKQSFLGGAALLTVTMLITKAIGALYKIPLGNLLDEQGMNYFYAAYNIYNLLLMVSTAGLPLALSRLVSQAEALGRVNRRRRTVSVAFWLFLLLGAVSSGVMFFLAGDLAGWMHNTQAENAIRVLSPAVLCVCLVSVIRGYTQGLGVAAAAGVSLPHSRRRGHRRGHGRRGSVAVGPERVDAVSPVPGQGPG